MATKAAVAKGYNYKSKKQEEPKFSFVSDYLRDRFGGKTIYTHMVDAGKKSKSGNPLFTMNVYCSETDEQLDKATVLQLVSKKGNTYYSVIHD